MALALPLITLRQHSMSPTCPNSAVVLMTTVRCCLFNGLNWLSTKTICTMKPALLYSSIIYVSDCFSWDMVCDGVCLMVVNLMPREAVTKNSMVSTNMRSADRQTDLFWRMRFFGANTYWVWFHSCSLPFHY